MIKPRILAISYCAPPGGFPRSTQVSRLLSRLGTIVPDIRLLTMEDTAYPEWVLLDNGLTEYYLGTINTIRMDTINDSGPKYTSRKILYDIPESWDEFDSWIKKATETGAKLRYSWPYSHLITFGQPWCDHLIGLELKRMYPELLWVSHFSDPWTLSPYWTTKNTSCRTIEQELERKVLELSSSVVFTNPNCRDLYLQERKDVPDLEKKAYFIANCTDLTMKTGLSLLEPTRKKQDVFEFVHTGNFFGDLRTAEIILAAYANFLRSNRNIKTRITLVGNLNLPKSFNLPANLISGQNIRFIDPVPYSESLKFMAEADALLIQDTTEDNAPFFTPSKLQEYLHFNKPVIAICSQDSHLWQLAKDDHFIAVIMNVSKVSEAFEWAIKKGEGNIKESNLVYKLENIRAAKALLKPLNLNKLEDSRRESNSIIISSGKGENLSYELELVLKAITAIKSVRILNVEQVEAQFTPNKWLKKGFTKLRLLKTNYNLAREHISLLKLIELRTKWQADVSWHYLGAQYARIKRVGLKIIRFFKVAKDIVLSVNLKRAISKILRLELSIFVQKKQIEKEVQSNAPHQRYHTLSKSKLLETISWGPSNYIPLSDETRAELYIVDNFSDSSARLVMADPYANDRTILILPEESDVSAIFFLAIDSLNERPNKMWRELYIIQNASQIITRSKQQKSALWKYFQRNSLLIAELNEDEAINEVRGWSVLERFTEDIKEDDPQPTNSSHNKTLVDSIENWIRIQWRRLPEHQRGRFFEQAKWYYLLREKLNMCHQSFYQWKRAQIIKRTLNIQNVLFKIGRYPIGSNLINTVLFFHKPTALVKEIIKEHRPKRSSEINRLHVLQLIGSLGPGGSERQLTNLSIGLAERGVEVTVLVIRPASGSDGHYKSLLTSKNVRVLEVELATPSFNLGNTETEQFLPYFLEPHTSGILKVIKELKPDIVHNWLDLTNIWGTTAAILANAPGILMSTRSVSPHHFFESNNFWYKPWYREFLKNPKINIVNNSKAGAEDYSRWLKLKNKRIKIVHNGIRKSDIDLSPNMRYQQREKIGIATQDILVIGVMRLSEEKQPHLFLNSCLEAIKMNKNIHAALVGDGPLMETIKTKIEDSNFSSNFHILGRRKDVDLLMLCSDLLLLTSRVEGSPNVILEAQSNGLPVLTTPAGGAIDAIKNGVTGYIVKPNPKAISKRIEQLAADPHLRETLGKAAKNNIEVHFTQEKMVDKTIKIYHEILAST